jgi:hypothetical protein
MKKLFIVIILFLFFPQTVSAHLPGQPPFFKINGVYSLLYDVPTVSFAEFKLPQDKPPALYVVNEDIHFEIDTNALPVPPEIVAISTFDWDWGDGTKHGSGMSNTHRYSKPGSYFLEITAKTQDSSQPQLIQSTLVNIVPKSDYKLPEAKILINGEGTTDPLLDDVKIEFGNDFSLDGSESIEGSGKIVQYIWDLGNGKSQQGKNITYRYGSDQYAFFPVLRVIDENGLFSDTFIQITNTEDGDVPLEDLKNNSFYRNRYILITSLVALLLVSGAVFVFRKKKN